MRRAVLILFAVHFAVVGLLLSWAVWLLVTKDPDGGRHPVGGAMLAAALVLGIVGAVSVRGWRRT